MRLRWVLIALAALAALTAAGCRDLPDLGTCGNGIVEEANGEACDDPGNSETCTATCELKCTPSAVDARYVQAATAATPLPEDAPVFCPGNEYRCGTDQICRAPSGRYEPLGPALPFDIGAAPATGDVDNDGLPDLVGTSSANIYIRFASTTGTPLGQAIVQASPSADAPPVIFDPRPATKIMERSELLFAVPTEGVALLQSDDERFAPEPEVPIEIQGDNATGLVVRDPDLDARLGDVVVGVSVTSASPEILVNRVEVKAPDRSIVIPGKDLPACVGAGTGPWHLVDAEAAGDRRSFVVVTQRDGAAMEPWHVCRYTHAGGSWVDTQQGYLPEAPIREASLANLDGDECLELVLRSEVRLLVVDAAGPACSLAPAAAPLPFAGTLSPLLAAGPIAAGGVDELVLERGVYRACTATEDCGASAPGTFVLAAGPTNTNTAWAAAVVVDLNRDGFLDVVAGRKDQVNVDVVRGGEVTLNVYSAPTSGPVLSLVAGDFDGDRLGDVALAERSPMNTDRILVLFGSQEATAGSPIAMSGPRGVGGRVRLDRFTEMSWVQSGRAADGIDDLAIIAPGSPTRAGFMLGDAARVMTTPRLPPGVTKRVPLAGVAAGAFHGGDAEILAFSQDRALFYSAANLMNPSWTGPSAPGPRLQNPVTALRNDADPARGAALEVGTGNQLFVFSVRVMNGTDVIERQCTARTSGMRLGELRAIDLEGNGADEVVAVSDNGGPDTRRVQIFDASCQELHQEVLAGCVDVAPTGRGLVALCRVTADPGRGPARGVFSIQDGKKEPVIDPFVVGDARFVTPGDFDGDGVVDVALSQHRVDEVVVYLLRQCPAHDTRRCPPLAPPGPAP